MLVEVGSLDWRSCRSGTRVDRTKGRTMNGTTATMTMLQASLLRLEARLVGWLARYSIVLLRVSLGLVFLGFGLLKFFPGASPAEDLAERTMSALTLGLIPGDVGIVGVAVLE